MRNHHLKNSLHYTVAFNRDRDSYQVPLALHEAGILASLVTDYYAPDRYPGKAFVPAQLRHRRTSGLPAARVATSFKAFAVQAYHEFLRSSSTDWHTVDSALSRAAAKAAMRTSSHLLLYSHYALEAFSDKRLADRKKGLFVFHPHHRLITDILTQDSETYPETEWSMRSEREIADQQLKERLDSECSLADFYICASSFTQRSLLHHGVSASKLAVAPYGTFVKTPRRGIRRKDTPTRFLFVGQGVQRKGLHHLLRAWHDARLVNSTLRLVCSRLDPGFVALTNQPNIQLSGAISDQELGDLFASSHVFVMPSLVEGFGLVYLEALAAGCFLISTPNTGVPDLQLPESMAAQVNVGDIGQLTTAIRLADELHAKSMIDHESIRLYSESLSWARFRRRVVESLETLCQ